MIQQIARGDVVWASMDPTIGREQPSTGLGWCCPSRMPIAPAAQLIMVPLTHTDRGWSTHVKLTSRDSATTVAMCEQVKSMSIGPRHPR